MNCEWIKKKEGYDIACALQLSNSVLGIDPREIHVPNTRRLYVLRCSVAQSAQSIISGIGKETVVHSFHGIVNGSVNEQTRWHESTRTHL